MVDTPITTERLVLEPITKDHIPFFTALYMNPDVVAGWGEVPYEGKRQQDLVDRLLRRWRPDNFCQYVVRERGSNELVGVIGMRPTEEIGCGELGYLFSPHVWGKGYATEAGTACVGWAFEDLKLEKVVANGLSNPASMRVMEKLQFAVTSEQEREHVTFKSYAVLRERWIADKDA